MSALPRRDAMGIAALHPSYGLQSLKEMPDRQISDLPVQPHLKKHSCFRRTQIKFRTPAIPSQPEGRFAIVTNAGRDAVDASGAKDERARLADGEVVWS